MVTVAQAVPLNFVAPKDHLDHEAKSENSIEKKSMPIGKANPAYKQLTPEDRDHFLTKGWLLVPGAIKEEFIDKWMKDVFVRIGYDEHDKSTWHTEYLRT